MTYQNVSPRRQHNVMDLILCGPIYNVRDAIMSVCMCVVCVCVCVRKRHGVTSKYTNKGAMRKACDRFCNKAGACFSWTPWP
mmetsp:Transcript_16414/g.33269  ORF Transcript_16414/g.33269 Transcript_16414/m.33269 type:complete len:82 (+) Transcript_16414:303-548(+)